eukprot:m.7090 g.7090  ORF g.7090 m.7090 type:complete len:55 (+) comp17715_c0_seq1:287-451(+)
MAYSVLCVVIVLCYRSLCAKFLIEMCTALSLKRECVGVFFMSTLESPSYSMNAS